MVLSSYRAALLLFISLGSLGDNQEIFVIISHKKFLLIGICFIMAALDGGSESGR